MPIAYFDSSVLLAMLLQESRSGVCAALWDKHTQRVSSILLNAECWTAMRRHYARLNIAPVSEWVEDRTEFLAEALTTVQIMPVDSQVLEILRARTELADCKTLDALHLATALYFGTKGDDTLVIVSLDQKIRQTAKKLKLEVLPAEA